MAVGILYYKSSGEIHDLLYDIIEVEHSKVSYTGGYVDGFDPNEIGVIVTEDISAETMIVESLGDDELIVTNRLIVFKIDDRTLNLGDEVPVGLVDISYQFIKTADRDVNQRLADLELMLVEILSI